MTASKRFEWYMWNHYKRRPDELEITDSPGYWHVIGGCPGGEDCQHASRIAGIVCNGGTTLSVYFVEPDARDERGRFVSPHREWHRQRAALTALGAGEGGDDV